MRNEVTRIGLPEAFLDLRDEAEALASSMVACSGRLLIASMARCFSVVSSVRS
jgi:hypothetical protein